MPDPLAETTFAASRLDWGELEHQEHAAWLARTRSLLQLRQREIVPRLAGGVRVTDSRSLGPRAFTIAWRLADGSVLTLTANLGPEPYPADLPPGRLLHATHAMDPGTLPSWSVAWTLGRSA